LGQEIADFQQTVGDHIRSNQIPPERVYVADETGIWTGSVALRTRVDPATMDAGVVRHGNNGRDTGMVALSAAGEVDAQFIAHRRQVTSRRGGQTVVTRKGISGMGSEQMTQWAQGFAERHGQEGQLVLMMDRLGCHRNRDVQERLREARIEPFLLPAQSAKFISPCDNSFFSSLKARLRTMDTSTSTAKEAAFLQICREYDPETVRAYFAHCGWER
jgi:hypothetical protein